MLKDETIEYGILELSRINNIPPSDIRRLLRFTNVKSKHDVYVINYLNERIRYSNIYVLMGSKYNPLAYTGEKSILDASYAMLDFKDTDVLKVIKWNNDVFEITVNGTHIRNRSLGSWFNRLIKSNNMHDNTGVVLELNNNNGKVRKYRCLKHPEYTWDSRSKTGCPMCGGRVVDRDSFIAKSKVVHNNKYIEFGEYKSQRHKIMIKCPIHGWFSQLGKLHTSGHGCKECYYDSIRLKKDTND